MKIHSPLRTILLLLALSTSTQLLHADAESSPYEQLPRLHAERVADWQSIVWKMDGKKVTPSQDYVVVLGKSSEPTASSERPMYDIYLDAPVTVYSLELNEEASWQFAGESLTLLTDDEPFHVYGHVVFKNKLEVPFMMISPGAVLTTQEKGALIAERLELCDGADLDFDGGDSRIMSLQLGEKANSTIISGEVELGDLIMTPGSKLSMLGTQITLSEDQDRVVQVLEYNKDNDVSVFSTKRIKNAMFSHAKLIVNQQGVVYSDISLFNSSLDIVSEATLHVDHLQLIDSLVTIDKGSTLTLENARFRTEKGRITQYKSAKLETSIPLLSIKAVECASSHISVKGTLDLSVRPDESADADLSGEERIAIVLRGLPLRYIKSELGEVTLSTWVEDRCVEWIAVDSAEGEKGNAVFIMKQMK